MLKYEKPLNLILVEQLVACSYKILIVEFAGELQYWAVTKFEPTTIGSDPVNHSYTNGCNITEFVNRHGTANASELDAMLTKFLEQQTEMIIKISPNTSWHYFSLGTKAGLK